MTNNDIFKPMRFARYLVSELKRITADNGIQILAFGLIPVIAFAVSFLSSLIFNHGDYEYISLESRQICILFTTGIFSMWIPSLLYGHVTGKRRGSNWTLIPVSALEKTATIILCTAVAVPLMFLATYLACDFMATVIAGAGIGETLIASAGKIGKAWITGITVDYRWNMVWSMHVSLLTFLLGAIFFRKGKIAKTVLVLSGLSIIALFLFFIGLENFIDDNFFSGPGSDEEFLRMLIVFANTEAAVGTVVLYILIYFRIKKIQY